jgi:hypothetical protein
MFMADVVCYSESMDLADKAIVKFTWKRDLYGKDIVRNGQQTTEVFILVYFLKKWAIFDKYSPLN